VAQKEYLALIAQENTRLSRMVENFLAFSRMERNTFPVRLEQVPVADLIDEAQASVSERFAAAGRRLNITVAEDCNTVACDSDAIVTALVNLLDNAHKFTPDSDAPISLCVSQHDSELRLAVRDHGIGLNRRSAARVFRRYYQVDQRLARATGGCGLGLSIVHHIMSAHGGRVTVESTPGEGSTFTLHLPLTPQGESSP
jgi:signal transduction histidine kinase